MTDEQTKILEEIVRENPSLDSRIAIGERKSVDVNTFLDIGKAIYKTKKSTLYLVEEISRDQSRQYRLDCGVIPEQCNYGIGTFARLEGTYNAFSAHQDGFFDAITGVERDWCKEGYIKPRAGYRYDSGRRTKHYAIVSHPYDAQDLPRWS